MKIHWRLGIAIELIQLELIRPLRVGTKSIVFIRCDFKAFHKLWLRVEIDFVLFMFTGICILLKAIGLEGREGHGIVTVNRVVSMLPNELDRKTVRIITTSVLINCLLPKASRITFFDKAVRNAGVFWHRKCVVNTEKSFAG